MLLIVGVPSVMRLNDAIGNASLMEDLGELDRRGKQESVELRKLMADQSGLERELSRLTIRKGNLEIEKEVQDPGIQLLARQRLLLVDRDIRGVQLRLDDLDRQLATWSQESQRLYEDEQELFETFKGSID